MKAAIVDKFIVFDEYQCKEVEEFSSLDDALESSYNDDNYQVIVLDKNGNNVSREYWQKSLLSIDII